MRYVITNSALGPCLSREAKAVNTRPTGEQKRLIVRFVSERGPVTIREVADELGLNRPTVETALWRLRREGAVTRERGPEGPYRYRFVAPAIEANERLVREFVHRKLGGAISPVVAFVSREVEATDEEL